MMLKRIDECLSPPCLSCLLDVSTIVLDEEVASSDQVSASSSDHVSRDGFDLITDPLLQFIKGQRTQLEHPPFQVAP